jgi:threonine dehydratase
VRRSPEGEAQISSIVTAPTLLDVLAARARVYAHLQRTPLLRHPLLAAETGLDLYVKHENHNPTCSFKVRGGLNLVAGLGPGERRGIIAASTGNHGQSMAFAAAREGIPCTVVTPRGNNPDKNASMRAMGAEVLEYGRDFDEAREKVEELSVERRLRYVHSANEPLLIAGVATYALEIFESLPDVNAIVVPIGGGSGASGCGLVRTALGTRTKIIGVQSARADAFARSWRSGTRVTGESASTIAEGMATRVTFDLTFEMLRRELDEIVTLTEEELAEGIRLALRATHNLAEAAGAAPLMAAAKLRDRFAGERVVGVMTGGNLDAATLRQVIGS